MQQITDLANKFRTSFTIKFDSNGVKFLEGFIERIKTEISIEERKSLINSCGAFLGQCIIENFGGEWMQNENGEPAVSFDEKNKVFPFSKVAKQFENGLEDSTYSMYVLIPKLFKLQSKVKAKWWQFWK